MFHVLNWVSKAAICAVVPQYWIGPERCMGLSSDLLIPTHNLARRRFEIAGNFFGLIATAKSKSWKRQFDLYMLPEKV